MIKVTCVTPVTDVKATTRAHAVRFRYVLGLLLALLLGLAASPAASAQDAPPPPPRSLAALAPGLPGNPTNVEFLRPNQEIRSAIISVTSNYDPNHPIPVLFGFGGWHDSPENYRNYSRFANTGAAQEAIVVYPRGRENAWEGAPYARTLRGGDVAFVRQIVAELQHHFNVDMNRIYAAGMSNGGGFAANLACQAPDLMAGVVGVSGAYYNPVNEGCAPGSVPTFLVHGADDKLTHYNGGALHEAPYLPVMDLIHNRAQANGCAPQPVVQDLQGGVVTQFGFPGCQDEAVHWRINGQDHNWFFSPDIANETWNFLARQNKALQGPAE